MSKALTMFAVFKGPSLVALFADESGAKIWKESEEHPETCRIARRRIILSPTIQDLARGDSPASEPLGSGIDHPQPGTAARPPSTLNPTPNDQPQ